MNIQYLSFLILVSILDFALGERRKLPPKKEENQRISVTLNHNHADRMNNRLRGQLEHLMDPFKDNKFMHRNGRKKEHSTNILLQDPVLLHDIARQRKVDTSFLASGNRNTLSVPNEAMTRHLREDLRWKIEK